MRRLFDPSHLIALGLAVGPIGAGFAADGAAADEVVRTLQRQDARVLEIGERLAVASRPFCPSTPGWAAGMMVQQLSQFGGVYREAAARIAKVGDRPTVTILVPGGAAELAGFLVGDQLLLIDGIPFDDVQKPGRRGDVADTVAANVMIAEAIGDGLAQFAVDRDGQRLVINLQARPACKARFNVRAGNKSNASSNGERIQVSSALVREFQRDGELAAVIAHELAHNILRHPQRRRANEPGLKVRMTEEQADRLSAYLLDAAGYDMADALAFWERWGRATDLGILSDRTHPGWRKRAAAISAEAARIATMRAAGQPIEPPPDLRP